MAKLIQMRLYDDKPEIITPSSDQQSDWLKKFDRKKTTDDCYTPPEVYEVVVNWVREKLWHIPDSNILRCFKPGGDYLAEDYNDKVVVDNPPFSIYSKIVENYERLGVLFFLFAPALTTFVKTAKTVSYIITGANIRYENGARVRTNFITNIPDTPRIIIAHDLKLAIENAQRGAKKALSKTKIPAPYLSSAQLLKWANIGNFTAPISHDYITHADRRKIFGAAVRIEENAYNNLLNAL